MSTFNQAIKSSVFDYIKCIIGQILLFLLWAILIQFIMKSDKGIKLHIFSPWSWKKSELIRNILRTIQNSNLEYNNETAPSGWIVTKFLSLDESSDFSFAVQQQSNVLSLYTRSFESINAKQSTGLSPGPSPSTSQLCHVFLGVPIVPVICAWLLFFGGLIK